MINCKVGWTSHISAGVMLSFLFLLIFISSGIHLYTTPHPIPIPHGNSVQNKIPATPFHEKCLCRLYCTLFDGMVHVDLIICQLLLRLIYAEVGGNRRDGTGIPLDRFDTDHSNLNGDSSICRVMRKAKRELLANFTEHYTASNTFCDLSNRCTNVSCSADFSVRLT